jgi:hypothetical protein
LALKTKYGVSKEYGQIIGRTTIDGKASRDAERHNRAIDKRLSEEREEWSLVPPSNMTLAIKETTGAIPAGLTLSVPHEAGRAILHKRKANILEHEVRVDAEIESNFEDTFEAMELGTVKA